MPGLTTELLTNPLTCFMPYFPKGLSLLEIKCFCLSVFFLECKRSTRSWEVLNAGGSLPPSFPKAAMLLPAQRWHSHTAVHFDHPVAAPSRQPAGSFGQGPGPTTILTSTKGDKESSNKHFCTL